MLFVHLLRLHVVCPSVMLVDQDHISWKSWKLIPLTINTTSSLFVAQRPSCNGLAMEAWYVRLQGLREVRLLGFPGELSCTNPNRLQRNAVMTQSELHKYIGYINGLGRRNPKLNRVPADYVEHRDPPYDRYRLFISAEELFLLPSWQPPIERRMIQINDISDVNARPRWRSRLILY